MLDDLRTLQHLTIALQTLLGAGEGRKTTRPVFSRVMVRVGQARSDAAAFPEIAAQQQHIDAANKILSKLVMYYSPPPKLLPPPPPPPPTPPDEPEE